MEQYIKKTEIRWADLDPNFHMLHSRYYDLGGYCRVAYLHEHGITTRFMQEHHIGPILFREECIFKKEIAFGDEISVNVQLQKYKPDFSKWTMIHELWKNEHTLAAVITCDGAWMDTVLRKLTVPPAALIKVFSEMPKTSDCTII